MLHFGDRVKIDEFFEENKGIASYIKVKIVFSSRDQGEYDLEYNLNVGSKKQTERSQPVMERAIKY